MSEQASPPKTSGAADPQSQSKAAFELVVGKATDKFDLWQQLPAWCSGSRR